MFQSTSEEIGFLRRMFNKFDKLNDGEISLDEFSEALSENYDYSDDEIQAMFHGIDIDGTGKVHYIEFLAATMEAHGAIDEERYDPLRPSLRKKALLKWKVVSNVSHFPIFFVAVSSPFSLSNFRC